MTASRNTMIQPFDLTLYFQQQIGDQIDPEMFTDHDSRPDVMSWSSDNELSYAVHYVRRLEINDLQQLVATSVCDSVAFRYYVALEHMVTIRNPYSNEELRSLYFTALAIVLAQLYRYVQRKREAQARAFHATSA